MEGGLFGDPQTACGLWETERDETFWEWEQWKGGTETEWESQSEYSVGVEDWRLIVLVLEPCLLACACLLVCLAAAAVACLLSWVWAFGVC